MKMNVLFSRNVLFDNTEYQRIYLLFREAFTTILLMIWLMEWKINRKQDIGIQRTDTLHDTSIYFIYYTVFWLYYWANTKFSLK